MKSTRPSAAPRPDSRWRRHAFTLAGIWLLALAAYSNSFRAGLLFDSASIVLGDQRLTAATAANVSLIFSEDYWYKRSTTGLYRPFTTLSYLVNYAVLGSGPEPAGYHWVNFGIHAINVALVYWLGLILFDGRASIAGWMAALWSVHPVLTEAVTNVVGRADLLAGFGVLAGLLCHIRAAGAKTKWLVGLAAAASIGYFSKESGVVLLVAMLLYDLCFAGWRTRVRGYAAALVPLAVFLLIRARALAALPVGTIPYGDNPLVAEGFWSGRLTAVQVIGRELLLLAWPARLSCDYSYNQIPLHAWGWSALALAACLALAALAVLLRRRVPAVSFLIAFFFAALAPTANLVFPIGTIMAERFLYLPAIAFAGCAALGLARLPRRASFAVIAVLCAAGAARTFARNRDWSDDLALWTSAVSAAPESYKTHNSFAIQLAAQPGGIDRAVQEADRSLAILDSLPDERNISAVHAYAASIYRMKGETAGDPSWYRKALDAALRGRRIDAAYEARIRAENLARGHKVSATGWPDVYLELGRAYLRTGQPREALEAFAFGRSLRPDPAFFEETGNAHRALGDTRQAAAALFEGLAMNPSYPGFGAGLVKLYQETEPASCALSAAQGGFNLNLGCPLVREAFCTGTRDAAALYRSRGQSAAAAATADGAIRNLGCPAEMFR